VELKIIHQKKQISPIKRDRVGVGETTSRSWAENGGINHKLGRKWVRKFQNDKINVNCLMESLSRFSNTPVPFKNHFSLCPYVFVQA
jgi:hypothetical protein